MTGYDNNNRKAFAYAWNKLVERGFDPVSPHFLESAIEIETRAKMGTAAVYRHVLPVDCFAISSVDAVLALPYWRYSKGCQFEKHFADLIEIPWISPSPTKVLLKYSPCLGPPGDVPNYVKWTVLEGIEELKALEDTKEIAHETADCS
jgi:hypothetical protein